ncbi:MAG TPA: hypothetical protein PLT82_04135 [Candidatus Hydrogenedens sp.]|nr:hypothetical protein [Candidatus Hydrogenedens sp.]HOK08659.1 hypothetical protein [Candidatus Hydrogenedens sp.]HOL21021.1 hypothetical protein [Candidatus Hydrogenedens sp.]HPP58300.1 hypothetical protein [Candidatus Hydrogenedens sp.]
MTSKKTVFATIGFVSSLTSLTTITIPALSCILVIIGFIFALLGKGGIHKGMTIASIGMCLFAFIFDMIYLYIVLIGKA